LFRICGVGSTIKKLRSIIDSALEQNQELREPFSIPWEDYSVDVLCSILKMYFRELPVPLLTFELYGVMLTVAGSKDKPSQLHSLK